VSFVISACSATPFFERRLLGRNQHRRVGLRRSVLDTPERYGARASARGV